MQTRGMNAEASVTQDTVAEPVFLDAAGQFRHLHTTPRGNRPLAGVQSKSDPRQSRQDPHGRNIYTSRYLKYLQTVCDRPGGGGGEGRRSHTGEVAVHLVERTVAITRTRHRGCPQS